MRILHSNLNQTKPKWFNRFAGGDNPFDQNNVCEHVRRIINVPHPSLQYALPPHPLSPPPPPLWRMDVFPSPSFSLFRISESLPPEGELENSQFRSFFSGRSSIIKRQRDSSAQFTVPGRAVGYFRYFWIFSLIKKDFVAFFIKLIAYFCTSPI